MNLFPIRSCDVISPLLCDVKTTNKRNIRAKMFAANAPVAEAGYPSFIRRISVNVSVGDWVLYMLSASDVAMVVAKRADTPGNNYNPVLQGQEYPALIVGAYGANANLKVFLDGEDTVWIPQRPERLTGEGAEGCFRKPSPWKPFDG